MSQNLSWNGKWFLSLVRERILHNIDSHFSTKFLAFKFFYNQFFNNSIHIFKENCKIYFFKFFLYNKTDLHSLSFHLRNFESTNFRRILFCASHSVWINFLSAGWMTVDQIYLWLSKGVFKWYSSFKVHVNIINIIVSCCDKFTCYDTFVDLYCKIV